MLWRNIFHIYIFEYFISSILQHCLMLIVHIQSSLARARGMHWSHYSACLPAKRQRGCRGTAAIQWGVKPSETEKFWFVTRHEFRKFATLLNILQKCWNIHARTSVGAKQDISPILFELKGMPNKPNYHDHYISYKIY